MPCPEGTFSDRRDLLDTKHCDICPKGFSCQAGSTSGNAKIEACPVNRFCPDGTKKSKIPLCPAGTYAPFTKSKSHEDCLECPAGSYCDGTENAGGVPTGPKDCLEGHYCPPGTKYSDQFPCPMGYYNDAKSGKSPNACLHCGFNKYCPDVGLIAPVQCPAGTYNSETTTAAYCTPCDAGYYCSQLAGFDYKLPCNKGFYSPKGAKECEPCPVGTFCPNEATSADDLKNQLCP